MSTSAVKSVKNASKLYHTYPLRDPAIPDLADILQRKRQGRKNMHNFNRAVDRRKCNSKKRNIHLRLKHNIQRFEKDIEDTSTTNNIWKITKWFTKHQAHRPTPVIYSGSGLTYTPLNKATVIAEVYEDQFLSTPENDEFDIFCQQIWGEIAAYL
jgi:hypothetical protein